MKILFQRIARSSCLAAAAFLCFNIMPGSVNAAPNAVVKPVAEPGPLIRNLTVSSRPGVKIWQSQQSVTPSITVIMSFPRGGAFDPEGKKGLSRLAAALFDEGAGRYDSSAFKALAADHNLTVQASASAERFFVKASFLRYDYQEVAELLNEALTQPRYDPKAIRRMKDQIVNVIRSSRSDPGSLLKKMSDRAVFGKHPFADPEFGYEKEVSAVTRADLRAFHRKLLQAPVFIAIAGDFNAAETEKFVASLTKNLAPKAEAEAVAPPPAFQGVRNNSLYLQSSQASIGIRKPAPLRSDPDYTALVAFNHILGGGGFGSRLTENLREQKGLTYSVNSDLYTQGGASYWEVRFAAPTDKTETALKAVNAEIAKIAAQGVTEKELANAKRYLKGVYALEFDRNDKIADLMHALYTLGLSEKYPQQRGALIDALTVDQVNATGRRYFAPNLPQVTSVISAKPEISDFAVQKKRDLRF